MKNKINIKILIALFVVVQISVQLYATLDLDFSQKRGYYNNSFQLIIECDDPNAIIRYTTNTSKPSTNNGNVYNGPITISNTTLLRAYAYNGFDESNVRTHSYIFVNDIVNANYMSTHITENDVYIPQLENSLKALPVISLVSSGINSNGDINFEVETSVEMFFPDKSRNGFMLHSGIQTWGGSPTNPKKHYRLEFKAIYGATKLNYKLYKADNYDNTEYKIQPAEKFDRLLLRSGSQDGLNAEYGHELRAQYVRNRVLFDAQIEMGYPAAHGRFVHLFVNGDYNGQYQLMERPDASFFESYYGGDKLDYEVYKSDEIWDGPYSLFNSNYWSLANGNNIDLSSANAIANTNKYIDLDQAAAYLLLMSYASGFDWSKKHNCLGGGNLTPGLGGYKFILWDVDFAIGNGGHWGLSYAGDVNYFNAPVNQDGPVPDNLVGNIEFNYMMADHMECTCYNNGILTPNKIDELYMNRINQVITSLIAESARWGNYSFSFSNNSGQSAHVSDNNWDVNSEFTNELNRMRNNYFPQRTTSMINHYKSKNLTSNLNAVEFNQYGGLVNEGFELDLTNPNQRGNIIYTTDGTDPRAVGGGKSATAIEKNDTDPIYLPMGITTIKARVRDNSQANASIQKWSAMCPRTFYVAQNYHDLVINEIHYNPADSIFFNPTINSLDTVSGRNFEFIELKNMGSEPVNLKDVSFTKGVTLQFDENIVIQPNSFIIVAEDALWFQHRYGFAPDAIYTGKLENSGETIQLEDPLSNIIDSITYDDNLPWDTIPDSGKYSLGLMDGNLDNSQSINWRTQIDFTTPKAENNFCDPMTAAFTKANASCFGFDDGFAAVTINGGTAPFTYAWSNGQNSNSISDLVAGTYFLTVTDDSQCELIDSISIEEPADLFVNITGTNETAYQANDGSAIAQVIGGTPPYSYNWSGLGTSANVSDLPPGSYVLVLTDSNGCTEKGFVTINAFNCGGISLNLNKTDESFYQAKDGSATAQVSGGGNPYTYNWSNGKATASINNLSPGSYTVNVTSANGCPLSETVVINSYVCSPLAVNVKQKDVTCFGKADGSLNIINIQNGTGPYVINWSNGDSGTATFNLSPGVHTLNIKDSFQCPFNETYTISSASALTLNETITPASDYNIADGAIDLTVSGGTAPYSFFWSNSQTTEDLSNLLAQSYWVSVNDANNCNVLKSSIEVGIDNNCLAFVSQMNQPNIPSGITQVQDYILSNGTVDIGSQVIYNAGNYIELQNYFEVKVGGDLEVNIDGCN